MPCRLQPPSARAAGPEAKIDTLGDATMLPRELPLGPVGAATVQRGREQLTRILDRQDPRLFVVVGPCSIHDPAAALEYARQILFRYERSRVVNRHER